MNDKKKPEYSSPESVEGILGRRIVLTSGSEISFCGIAREVFEVNSRHGMLVETDSNSGFSVWCPLDYIKSITIIPIPVDNPNDL